MIERRVKKMILGGLLQAALLAVLLAGGAYASMTQVVEEARYLPGSAVNGLDISGLTQEDAIERLLQSFNDLYVPVEVEVSCAGQTRVFSQRDMGIATNAREVFTQALQLPQKSSIGERLEALYRIRGGVECPVMQLYDWNALYQAVSAFAQEVYQAPSDAQVSFDAQTRSFVFTDEHDGWYLDADYATNLIYLRLDQGNFEPITLERILQPAQISRAQLEQNMRSLGVCTVELPRNGRIIENIQLMIEGIHGTMILPGDDFSFNAAWHAQGVIESLSGERVQVVSDASLLAGAIYQASVLSDLPVIQRRAPSKPSGLLPLGMDALVDEQQGKDLIVRNDLAYPVFISLGLDGRELTVEIMGYSQDDEQTVALDLGEIVQLPPPKSLYEADEDLDEDEQRLVRAGKPGQKISIFRVHYKGDSVIKTELISTDKYVGEPAVYAVAPDAPELTPPNAAFGTLEPDATSGVIE